VRLRGGRRRGSHEPMRGGKRCATERGRPPGRKSAILEVGGARSTGLGRRCRFHI
ncbi:hypothetical protein M885DRAFT_543669, partial [Pelagophyceae sp. CCMP2097]